MTSSRAVRFGQLRIAYSPTVLRPRLWTLAQSEWAVELLRRLPPGPILELCCGSGHIGLHAAVHAHRALVGVDANAAAVADARLNAIEAGIADRVEIRCSSLDTALAEHETFPLVIADPPWVPHADISRFPDDPPMAIDGGDDGLQVAMQCAEVVERHLALGGDALLQLGSLHQADRLACRLASRGAELELIDRRNFPGRGVIVHLRRTMPG